MPVASAALLILAAALPQEAAGDSSRRIQDTAQAARAIARDLALPGWAVKMIEQDRRFAQSGEDKAELELALADVQSSRGDFLRDPRERLAAYAAAGASYANLLEDYGSTTVAQRAQSQVGLTAFKFATTLDQLSAGEGVSEAARAELLPAADPFFKAAMKAMNALISWWEGLPDESEDRENARYSLYYPTQFYRGITYTAWARLHLPDSLERDNYSQRAIEYLNEFALSAGGVFSFIAYKLAADVHVLRGEYDTAREFYDYVLSTVKEILASPDPDQPLSPYEIERYEGAAMEATLGLLILDQTSSNEEDFQRVLREFDQWIRTAKIPLQEPGYRVRLIQARRLVDAGNVSEALTLAQEVARDNQRLPALRLQANAVMAYAIERAPADAEISLEALFQAAEGTQAGQEFERSAMLWRALIARLPGSAKEAEYMGLAHYNLAVCWHQLGEGLLAGKAAEAGWRAGSSDVDLQGKLARQWFNKAEALYRSRPTDEALKLWNAEALEAVNQGPSSGDDPAWRNAQNAMARANEAGVKAKGKAADTAEAKTALRLFAEAEKACEAIQPGSRYYEKALVQRGICAWSVIAWDGTAAARAAVMFEAYLAFIADPANAPKDATERKNRKESEPSAIYYLGDCWRQLAKSGQAEAWGRMLQDYEGYPERFREDQRELSHAVRDARIEAYLAMGQPDRAEAEFQALVQDGAKDKQIASSAWKLQSYFSTAADKNRSEGHAARQPLLRKAAEYLGIMNDRTANVSGDSLYREGRMRMELGEWAAAEKLLTRALNDAPVPMGERYRFGARADLIDVLLAQRRVGQAVPLLDQNRAESANDRRVLAQSVKVLAGFLVIEKGQVLEVPGDGKPESLQKALEAASTLLQLEEAAATTAGLNKFMVKSWWEARTDQVYVYWSIGKTDPGQADAARKIIASLESLAADLGESVCGPDVPAKLRWIQQR